MYVAMVGSYFDEQTLVYEGNDCYRLYRSRGG